MPLETRPFDAARYIDEEGEREILADAASTGDANYIRLALDTVARARGMTAIAQQAGISRGALFDATLAEDGSGTEALLAVFRALGAESLPGTAAAE